MNKFTLDTNCIIDLEENRPNAAYIRTLVNAWVDNKIELAVVAVSASENQASRRSSQTFADFEQKLKKTGLTGVRCLLPLAKWDVFYWDHALWGDDSMEKLESEIRDILFPTITTLPPKNIEKNSRWRNQLCDVLVAWSHAYHRWDYLVTSDKNFHKHKHELKRVGINAVICPEAASKMCQP